MAENTLTQWLTEEQEIRARQPADGRYPDTFAQYQHRPGIDYLQAIINGRCPQPPICATLDFLLLHVEPGVAVFQGEPLARHNNPLGSVHGGWFATLLDSALGCAVHTRVPPERLYTTLEMKLNIVRPLFDGMGRIRARGECLHVGRQTATAQASLIGPDDKLYAHATTTCLIYEPRPAA